MQEIIVATDFSGPAGIAADRAARLAHEHNLPLTLLHVMPASPLQELAAWLGNQHGAITQWEQDSQSKLDQLAKTLGRQRHIAVQAALARGVVSQEIARAVAQRAGNLLVLGARGEGFLRRLMLGTNTERLVRSVHGPVLVVRQPAHEKYRRVMVAVDFSTSSKQALAAARHVAPTAHFILVHAWQVPLEGKLHYAGVDASTIAAYRQRAAQLAHDRMQVFASEAQLPTSQMEVRVVEGPASQRLIEQEMECRCDLLAIGKQGQTAAEDFFLGSVTSHMLADGSADVLLTTGVSH